MKAIILDAYGTLISTGNGSIRAAGEILALNRRGDIPPETFYADWKKSHRRQIDALDSFVNEAEIFKRDLDFLYQKYGMTGNPRQDVQVMLQTLGKREAFPETGEVLSRLSRRYLLAIGSTTDTEPLLQDLARNRLHVAHVFTSESLRVYKPRPEFYRQILHHLGLQPAEALFVGDSLTDDVWGPQQVGMPACWVNRKGGDAGTCRPDFEIPHLRALPDILGGEPFVG